MTDLPILSHQTVPAATSSAGTFSVPPLTTADSSSFSRRRGSHRSLDSTNPDGKRSLRRLAVKPLKIAGNLRRGLSPSPSNNRLSGGMTTPQGSTPTFTPKESNLALTPSSSAGSMSTNDPSSKVMAARGRVKPREGEEVLAMLRLRVVRCEGLVAKDRNGTSDPFVTVQLCPSPRHQTPTISRSLSPTFPSPTSTFDLPIYRSLAESGAYRGRGIEIVVWDKDLLRREYMGECSIGVGEWFENEEGVGLWDDSNGGGIGEQGYELVSSRRRSAVSGKVWLGIGWVKGGKMQDEETARQVWRELKNLSTSKMGSLTTVPAYEGIGTVKIRRRRFNKSVGKSALSSVIPHPFHRKSKDNDAAAPSAIPDVDPEPDHSEEEDLRDDGLSSDSSDEEHIASHQHQVGRKRSTMESTTSVAPAPIAINIASTPSSPEEQPLSRSPEKEAFGKLTVSQSEQGISSRVTSHRQAGVQSDTESSGLTSNKQPLSHKSSGQSYFDLSSSTGSGSGTATVPSTPGRRFPIRRATRDGSNSPAPSMSTQGGDTPGGNKRRPIFHRGKNKTGTQYNFAQSKDILGIVMLEICGATGLPKIKNTLKTSFDMDPFVVISFGKKVFRTRVIRHSLNPTWDEKMLFHVRQHEDLFLIQFSLLDWDNITGNDYIGSCSIPMTELVADAPSADLETGLYDANEDGKHDMKEFTLSLATPEGASWAAKYSPQLTVRAKYEPYDALRQRFWRQYILQYDSDDTGSLSYTELTTMLDSLGSTLTTQTLRGYFESHGKSAEMDELTVNEVIQSLEQEVHKSKAEKSLIRDTPSPVGGSPVIGPVGPRPEPDGLDLTGPNSRIAEGVNADELAEHIRASRPESQGLEDQETNLKPIQVEDLSASSSVPNVNALQPAPSGSLSPGESIAASDVESDADDKNMEVTERVVNIKQCPLCHRPRLKKKSEADIITHLAVCASSDWNRVDRIVVGNYVTASQAQRKFMTKILTSVSMGSYKLGANSANIIVQDRATGQLQEEKIASYVRIGIRVLYHGARSRMEGARAKKLLKSMSIKQGLRYDDPASAREIPTFIAFHKLNINEIREPIESFKTFNQFFYRKLKPGARPITEPDNPDRLVSCADCRMMAFATINDATRIWIKGRDFSLSKLLGPAYKDESPKYDGGALSIFRLAPQDYHRYHSPVDGTVGKCTYIEGHYFTVNPMAVRSNLDIYAENVRMVVPIHSPQFGTVMTVWIGAMMVGSIGSSVKEGDEVKRGDELGWFAFGGSTIVCVFEKGMVRFDDDLLQNGQQSIETLVRYGNGIGRRVAK